MDLVFRAALPSDIEGLFSVRARTRENPISKEQLASLGITAESTTKNMASGRVRGWVVGLPGKYSSHGAIVSATVARRN